MSLLLAQEGPPRRPPLVTRLWIVGGGAMLLWLIVAVIWPHAAMRSYLFGYLFFVDLSLGMLGLLALQYCTGGAWGAVVRRTCEAGAAALPMLALLGVPLLIGAPWVFPWADRAQIAADPVIAHRLPWIGLPWVAGRSAVFFAILIAIATAFTRWSLSRSPLLTQAMAEKRARHLDYLSRFTLCALFVVVSIWATDFVMALEPHWVSTAFGMMMLCGQACTAMAVIILTFAFAQRHSPTRLLSPDRVHDLGKLLLTTLVLWAYISFAQFLIQWLGSTQTDVPFYAHRLNGGWRYAGTALIFLHLGLPLVLLMFAPRKRDLKRLARVAAFILAMRWIDTLWLVAPSSVTDAAGWLLPTDLLTPIGIGAFWLSVFVPKLLAAPLVATTYETSGANEPGLATMEVPHAD